MKIRLTITTGIVAAAVTAVPAMAGHGGDAASHYTPEALKALWQRWEAKANFYGKRSLSLMDERSAATSYTPRALKAMGQRGEAMARVYSPGATPPPAGDVVYVDGLVLDRRSGAHVAVPPDVAVAPAEATTLAQPPPTDPAPSFDWRDAAIGAGVGGAGVFVAAIAFAVTTGLRRGGKLAPH